MFIGMKRNGSRNQTMRAPPELSASRALLSIPAGSFLRHNSTTRELELVGSDGAPLTPEQQQAFFSQLPEVTVATLKVSILYCT
jgi:hypothetical protein